MIGSRSIRAAAVLFTFIGAPAHGLVLCFDMPGSPTVGVPVQQCAGLKADGGLVGGDPELDFLHPLLARVDLADLTAPDTEIFGAETHSQTAATALPAAQFRVDFEAIHSMQQSTTNTIPGITQIVASYDPLRIRNPGEGDATVAASYCADVSFQLLPGNNPAYSVSAGTTAGASVFQNHEGDGYDIHSINGSFQRYELPGPEPGEPTGVYAGNTTCGAGSCTISVACTPFWDATIPAGGWIDVVITARIENGGVIFGTGSSSYEAQHSVVLGPTSGEVVVEAFAPEPASGALALASVAALVAIKRRRV